MERVDRSHTIAEAGIAFDDHLRLVERRPLPYLTRNLNKVLEVKPSSMATNDVSMVYNYSMKNKIGLPDTKSVTLDGGFRCGLCDQMCKCYSLLKLHLCNQHEDFYFDIKPSEAASKTWYVNFAPKETVVARLLAEEESPSHLHLVPSRKKFDVDEVLRDGLAAWIDERKAPRQETLSRPQRTRRTEPLTRSATNTETSSVQTPSESRQTPFTSVSADEEGFEIAPRPQLRVPRSAARLFHSVSKKVLVPDELLQDDEDDIDIEWRIARHAHVIRDFTDLTDNTKEYYIHWDTFLERKSYIARGGIKASFLQFVAQNEMWFPARPSRSLQLAIHLALHREKDDGVDEDCVARCAKMVASHRIKYKERAKVDIESIPQWPPSGVRLRSSCICLKPVFQWDMVLCGERSCENKFHHRKCLPVDEEIIKHGPNKWKCNICRNKAAENPQNERLLVTRNETAVEHDQKYAILEEGTLDNATTDPMLVDDENAANVRDEISDAKRNIDPQDDPDNEIIDETLDDDLIQSQLAENVIASAEEVEIDRCRQGDTEPSAAVNGAKLVLMEIPPQSQKSAAIQGSLICRPKSPRATSTSAFAYDSSQVSDKGINISTRINKILAPAPASSSVPDQKANRNPLSRQFSELSSFYERQSRFATACNTSALVRNERLEVNVSKESINSIQSSRHASQRLSSVGKSTPSNQSTPVLQNESVPTSKTVLNTSGHSQWIRKTFSSSEGWPSMASSPVVNSLLARLDTHDSKSHTKKRQVSTTSEPRGNAPKTKIPTPTKNSGASKDEPICLDSSDNDTDIASSSSRAHSTTNQLRTNRRLRMTPASNGPTSILEPCPLYSERAPDPSIPVSPSSKTEAELRPRHQVSTFPRPSNAGSSTLLPSASAYASPYPPANRQHSRESSEAAHLMPNGKKIASPIPAPSSNVTNLLTSPKRDVNGRKKDKLTPHKVSAFYSRNGLDRREPGDSDGGSSTGSASERTRARRRSWLNGGGGGEKRKRAEMSTRVGDGLDGGKS